MRDRSEQILRLVCLILAALLVADLVRAGFRARPLIGVVIPAVPTLETNAPAAKPVSMGKTPAANMPMKAPMSAPTNGLPATNLAIMATGSSRPPVLSNTVVAVIATNAIHPSHTGTNLISTNALAASGAGGTTNQTNSATAGHIRHLGKRRMPTGMPGGMGFAMMGGMPGNAPKLAPEIQARVDRIVNSEIFAPVNHPLPMGLLGIAGDTAFLRTADGQTGLVKVGDSVGDVKLLRIGVNRVLVEQGGQTNELTIFDGFGGDSLLTEQNKNSK